LFWGFQESLWELRQLEVYDPDPLTSLPQKIKLGLRVKDGGHLPAVIHWDFDVDNNLNTGWSSMVTGMEVAEPCNGKCKDLGTHVSEEGWDFQIILVLRDQSDNALGLADCNTCIAPKFRCGKRGERCTNCNFGECYSLGGFCSEGDDDCYDLIEGTLCDCNEETKCAIIDIPCGTNKINCQIGLVKGRWYAPAGEGKMAYARGDVYVPLDYDFTSETELCVELPWGRIVSRIHELNDEISHHGQFDLSYAMKNPPVVQVTAWFDPEFADGEDYIGIGSKGMKLDVSDWAPDAPVYGVTADWNNGDTKKCDLDADGDCDLLDVIEVFKGFGSTGLPACFPSR